MQKSFPSLLIEHLKPSGNVLEVGFGLGDFATQVQSYRPKSHTIIESNPFIAKKARVFAEAHPHVKLIEGTWQEALTSLGKFDTIFIGGYPAVSQSEKMLSAGDIEKAQTLMQNRNESLRLVEEKLPEIEAIKYSDKDLDVFCEMLLETQATALVPFLCELQERGQITPCQLERLTEKYQLGGSQSENVWAHFWKDSDYRFSFIQECLGSHLQKEGRFSCFIQDSKTRFEDPGFFEHVITHPELDYQENPISFGSGQVLLMTVSRL